MPRHRCRALGLAALIALNTAVAPAAAVTLDYIATYVWTQNNPDFGGFSGLEITDDGTGFHALSDRARIFWGSIRRDPSGRIRDMTLAGQSRLRDSGGTPLPPGRLGDSEGLALDPNGGFWVSFEGLNRIAFYPAPDAPARRIASPPAFDRLIPNAALEALAVTRDGTVLTIPEDSGARDRPFPVWRFRDGKWDQPWTIPRSGRWLVVGADIGPDDRLYVLERDFLGIRGFASRVRRFDMTDDGPVNQQVLLETAPLHYDNLEGISVWRDSQGIRITMISDDNFFFVQRTELVEYRVREDQPPQQTAP